MGQFENRFTDFREMARVFSVLNTKPPGAENNMLELAHLYSEDAVLPFLIANDMHRAFPNLTIPHIIYKTIPISASAERNLSRLKLTKSYLLACMNDPRLSKLTLLCTERDIDIDKDKVVGRFANMKERRMTF
ncbi:hypothetical protein J4Q44_G00238010 [Coregonus suidteri]|uniref:Uncharacterized protein n=1 Tax=Coregonus suidteri TaxID=861788 RepID=A0AAN8LJZ9_9TELE